MKHEDLILWFTEQLLPDIVKKGDFSDGKESQTLEKCELEDSENYVTSFASFSLFAKLTLKIASGVTTRDVLIKFQSQDPIFRYKMRMINQYKNEITFYNEVYPNFVEFLKTCGKNSEFIDRIVPKCYFASDGGGNVEKAIIIVEDLRPYGFRLSDAVTDLDLPHCLITVERLAQFHSISFAMKFKGWKPLDKFKTLFLEVLFEDKPICREQSEVFLARTSNRGIEYLLNQKDSPVPEEYLEKLKRMLEPIFRLQKDLYAPTEPLSVICHGDFNRNNTFYRYDNDTVVDAKLFDYQRALYGSPSLDLGFFIYMNTTLEFREKHFEQVFRHYYKSLVKNISTILNEEEKAIVDRIPIRLFEEDFEKVAICHYIIISFYLPIMMSPPDNEFLEDIKKSCREQAEKNYKKGGDAASRRIAEVIIDFYRRKFYLKK